MRELTERECAIRAAAIIDTDGTIVICKHRNTYVVRCQVANGDTRILDWMKDTYGGSVCSNGKKQRLLEGHKVRVGYTWAVSCKKAESFLRQITPFLILKENQALLAVGLRGLRARVRHTHTMEEKAVLFRPYYVKMKFLNKRGHLIDEPEAI